MEKCLSETGLAGNFSETFLEFLNLYTGDRAGAPKSPCRFVDCLQSCRDASGNYGMTLMADYLPEVSAKFFGETYQQSADWKQEVSANFLKHLDGYFDRVDYILLTRNVVRQAVSDVFAAGTGVYHEVDGQTWYGQAGEQPKTHEDVLSTFDVRAALKKAQKKRKETEFLRLVLNSAQIEPVEIDYETVTSEPSRLKDVLNDFGFHDAIKLDIKPKTKKVLSGDSAFNAGAKIAEYLEMEDWTWDTLEKFVSGVRYDYWELDQLKSEKDEISKTLEHVYRYPWKHIKSFYKRY